MTPETHGSVAVPVRRFLFQGSGKGYFVVWLVNILLTLITLGLYLPWALVRARRYFYENTELSGARFSYHATGRSIFVGWLCLLVLYVIFFINVAYQNVILQLCMMGLFLIFFPWLITQGLRYQMLMTEINGVRFNFYASPLRAWWVMMGCPLLIIIASVVVFSLFVTSALSSGSYGAISVMIGIGTLVLLLGIAIMQGVYAAQWFGMLINNLQYGKLKFSAEISMKKCITIVVLSMLLFVPFIVLVMVMIIPSFITMSEYAYAAGGDPEQLALMMGPLYGKLALSYLIYIAGAIVCFLFAFVKLRAYIYGQLALEGNIRFSSTVAMGRMFWISVTNMLVCGVTLFLAWPWAKVRMTRYLLENTHVHGDLEALTLEDHGVQPAKDPANLLARGLSFYPAVL
ncbi:YjgN family protein [Kosakonia sp. YIM B13605]|uniref:YjgN family protein n=1 Tax=unclassified Kosakonia TaxID=2632876 RepID=UPI0036C6A757